MRLFNMRMTDEEYTALRELAEARRQPMAETVREGLGCLVGKLGLETRADLPKVEAARKRAPVTGHRHSAAKTIAGGIAVCACGARRVLGSDWRVS